jgi:predicted metal-dependent peptidase
MERLLELMPIDFVDKADQGVLPGLVKGSSLHACVAIDTSGSISDEDCRDFLSEVAGIVSQFESYEIRIWCFDTKVYPKNGNEVGAAISITIIG